MIRVKHLGRFEGVKRMQDSLLLRLAKMKIGAGEPGWTRSFVVALLKIAVSYDALGLDLI